MHDTRDSTTQIRIERLLTQLLERTTRIETKVDDVAADVDALDRFNRPYGDGTRDLRRRRRD